MQKTIIVQSWIDITRQEVELRCHGTATGFPHLSPVFLDQGIRRLRIDFRQLRCCARLDSFICSSLVASGFPSPTEASSDKASKSENCDRDTSQVLSTDKAGAELGVILASFFFFLPTIEPFSDMGDSVKQHQPSLEDKQRDVCLNLF